MNYWQGFELPDNRLFPERYQIREIIRDGPASTLLLGHDCDEGRLVVIKCFKPDAAGAYVREIGAVFDLHHPNLVRCLGTFHRSDGVACIVYEHLPGGSLAELLAATGRLPATEVIACLRSILQALVYLHGSNRIHCDLKPENILLRRNSDGGFDCVLIDLGAACFLREAREGRHVTGTPAYVAPERINSRFFFNSDLYSLGIIAFEMCTGTRPFIGTVAELTQAHLTMTPSLTDIQPPVLRDFIDHLLVKSPWRRWPSAALALTLLDKACSPVNGRGVRIDCDGLVGLHCFWVAGHARAALVYRYFVQIVDETRQKLLRTLITEHPLQVLDDDLFAYATPSRIQTVRLDTDEEQSLKEGFQELVGWHLSQNTLLWGDAHYFYRQNTTGQDPARFKLPNYLFAPETTVLADGTLATTEGMANNDVVLRNGDAQPLHTWHLHDAVVAMGGLGSTLLVVTLNLSGRSSHSIWRLAYGQAPQQTVLPGIVKQPVCANGKVFWLSDHQTVVACDGDSPPQQVALFDHEIVKFAVSYRHDCLVAACRDGTDGLLLVFIKHWLRP